MRHKHKVYICDPEKCKDVCNGYHRIDWCGKECYSTLNINHAKRDKKGYVILNRNYMRLKRRAIRFKEKRRRENMKKISV